MEERGLERWQEKKQMRVLTHPDKMEQGVSLGTSHTHANILHHQYTLYMRACLKDQAPGSELLLKATDARNTASHIEPRTKKVARSHMFARTPQLFGLDLAGGGELIIKPQLIKPFTAHAHLRGEHTRRPVCTLSIRAFVWSCVFEFGFMLVKGEVAWYQLSKLAPFSLPVFKPGSSSSSSFSPSSSQHLSVLLCSSCSLSVRACFRALKRQISLKKNPHKPQPQTCVLINRPSLTYLLRGCAFWKSPLTICLSICLFIYGMYLLWLLPTASITPSHRRNSCLLSTSPCSSWGRGEECETAF